MKKTILFAAIPLLFSAFMSTVVASTSASKMIETGNQQWSENKVLEAEASFRDAIMADPGSAVAYSRLGALMVMQNRGPEAIEAYQEAITRAPENANYFAALSIAYLHMGYHAMAKTMAVRATELDPEMKHAQNISRYIDAKMERMAAASEAGANHPPVATEKSETATTVVH